MSNSMILGFNNETTTTGAFAIGHDAIASGRYSMAIGVGCIASGYFSRSMGVNIETSGEHSLGIALNNQTGTVVSQDNTMAIMGGKVGIGTVTPNSALEVNGVSVSRTPTGTAAGAGQFVSMAGGTAQGQIAAYSFYPTFMGTGDNGPRRAADILGGFNGGAWGTEFLSFNVGSSNDSQILTSEKMRIRADGKVGIGTNAPDYTLDVAGPVNLVKGMGTAIALRANGVEALWSNGTYFSWGAGGSYNKFNTPISINTTDPTQSLDVNGNARFRAIASIGYAYPLNIKSDGTLTTATSDIRMKENILTLTNALAKVISLRGVNFTWIKEPEMGTRIGFIAQEVESILPELVFTNPVDGYKGVNYAEMTAVLVEAIKEQQKQIEELKEKNKEIDLLKAELEAIKAMLKK
jgi:hypothetical protein